MRTGRLPRVPTLTPLTDALFDDAWTSLEESFGQDPHPEDREVERGPVDPARFLVALDEVLEHLPVADEV